MPYDNSVYPLNFVQLKIVSTRGSISQLTRTVMKVKKLD